MKVEEIGWNELGEIEFMNKQLLKCRKETLKEVLKWTEEHKGYEEIVYPDLIVWLEKEVQKK